MARRSLRAGYCGAFVRVVAGVLAAFLPLFLPLIAQAQQQPAPGAAPPPPPPKVAATGAAAPADADILMSRIPDPTVPAGAWVRSRIPIAPAAAPPKIDGRIDEDCWKKATRATGFYRLRSRGRPITEQTEAWITADKTHLYVAYHCLVTDPARIRASETQRGGRVFNDDHVSIDIDSQNTRRNFSTFIVTPRGTQWESIEGGTADNITWAGDWKAAAQRTKDGWTAEMAIPFALLRYPRGTQSFNILLRRKRADETDFEIWPYVPPEGENNISQYLNEFTGINPPFFAPRPTFLPYSLATIGEGTSARQGVDVKYPISTTLTGVATLFPDFRTIEQDVTSINFSYTEQFVDDRRPFFAEGARFLPSRDMFYSRRIGDVDGGLKVVGKSGDTTLGLLGTTAQGNNEQSALAFRFNRDIGLFSSAGLEMVANEQKDKPSNQVARLYGRYGWQAGQTRYSVNATHTPSWVNGNRKGSSDFIRIGNDPPRGRLEWDVFYRSTSPEFISDLGFVPEKNLRGYGIDLSQFDQFDKGFIEVYGVGIDLSTFQRQTGGFFRGGLSTFGFIQDRRGHALNLGVSRTRREQFKDQVQNVGLSWGNKSLFQRGGFNTAFGRQADKAYSFLTLRQGFLIFAPLSVQVDWSRLRLGEESSMQTILTGTYRLNSYQSIAGRLLQRSGGSKPEDQGTNLYFAFAQKVRAGTDLFLLFGDPNSRTTRSQVTLKTVSPF